jgi:hypothetical protein
MSKKYIEPVLIHSTKLDGINEYLAKPENYFFDKRNYSVVKYNDLWKYDRLIVLGEPGCGKSELIKQLTENNSNESIRTLKINLLDYNESLKDKMIESMTDVDLICFDALDEVVDNFFSKTVQFISEVSKKFESKKIVVSCRSYYIQNNLSIILAFLSDFQYLLIDKFNDEQITQFINQSGIDDEIGKSMIAKLSNKGGEQLKSVLKIPRYLNEICKLIVENQFNADDIENWKRSDFFDNAIYFQLANEFKDKGNKLELSKRVLEKLALFIRKSL